MKIQGTTTIAAYLGDFVVYRLLEPADRRLPGLRALAGDLGLAGQGVPRKTDAAYARVVARILQAARTLERPGRVLRYLLYVGDSPQLDGQAFLNLLEEGDWIGRAFIGKDSFAEPPALVKDGNIYRSNRWTGLTDFLAHLRQEGIPLDGSCAVVVDLDKTILGPRGRNDQMIDAARAQAAVHVAGQVLGEAFDETAFNRAYQELIQPKYHFFTQDNQDYVVYCAVMLASGAYPFASLLDDFAAGSVSTFLDFIKIVGQRIGQMAIPGLQAIQQEVAGNVVARDPTPFKSFRREEYLTTVALMAPVAAPADVVTLLKERITINYEVAQVVSYLRQQGVVALGLSDKPDEAVFPIEALAACGYRPLHRTLAALVGEPLSLG